MKLENFGEVIKKGLFRRMAFSSAKEYSCDKGDLTLTSKGLIIKCENRWSKLLSFSLFRFSVSDKILEVRDLYNRPRFNFVIDESEEWQKAIQSLRMQEVTKLMKDMNEKDLKRPLELREIFDMKPEARKRLYKEIMKARQEYLLKNMKFNLHVYSQAHKVKDRKLKAFIVAHSYVAWYEWLKSVLYMIHKAKFGKGPKNDDELMKFLDNYPSWKFLMDTSRWDIKPNQMRNCVSHERFFFDYRTAELVFIAEKEKRVPLRDLTWKIFPMANFYSSLVNYLHSAEK